MFCVSILFLGRLRIRSIVHNIKGVFEKVPNFLLIFRKCNFGEISIFLKSETFPKRQLENLVQTGIACSQWRELSTQPGHQESCQDPLSETNRHNLLLLSLYSSTQRLTYYYYQVYIDLLCIESPKSQLKAVSDPEFLNFK